MSWSCQYEVKGSCKRLKRDCRPGIKGCVLDGKVEFIPTLRSGQKRVGFEPDKKEGQAMAEKVETLDLRPMPPFQRHEKIFQTWDTLKPQEALKIINDHDPKPLWYQFEVEYKGKYEWNYEQKGPKDWIVKISKK